MRRTVEHSMDVELSLQIRTKGVPSSLCGNKVGNKDHIFCLSPSNTDASNFSNEVPVSGSSVKTSKDLSSATTHDIERISGESFIHVAISTVDIH